MDPFSLTVGIIGILQGVSSCIKLSRKHLGPSNSSSDELQRLMSSLKSFEKVMKVVEACNEMNDDDDDNDDSKQGAINAMQHLAPVLTKCTESVEVIKSFLERGDFVKKYLRGPKFDKKLKASLKALDESKDIFKTALIADQQIIVSKVEKYLQTVGSEVHESKSIIENQLQPAQHFRDVRAWFRAAFDDDNLNSQSLQKHLKDCEEGSCDWLMEDSAFKQWQGASPPQGSTKTGSIWLTGPPGFGKSMVCSKAIERIQESGLTTIYNFYNFSNHMQHTAIPVASCLIYQLFVQYSSRHPAMTRRLSEYVQYAKINLKTLREALRIILKQPNRGSNGCGRDDETRIFVFLDGLDEDPCPDDVREVITLFKSMGEELLLDVRFWFSCRSQRNAALASDLKRGAKLDIRDHAENNVHAYLSKTVRGLGNGDENIHFKNEDGVEVDAYEVILGRLNARAQGNFQFAKLMVDDMRGNCLTVGDRLHYALKAIPQTITDMYARIFEQYREGQRKYVCILYSLLAYSRRRLTLEELCEAMTMALSDPSRKMMERLQQPDDIASLFPPLIEKRPNPGDENDPFCDLCHSSAWEFLLHHPNVLSQGETDSRYTITNSVIANVCFRYLNQERYSSLLADTTALPSGEQEKSSPEVPSHHLMSYSAKYWDKHLDELDELEGASSMSDSVIDFLKSPNFQTLLQIQSRYVHHQFSHFSYRGEDTLRPKRVFPKWLKDISRYRKEYRHFINEWCLMLSCSLCACAGCPFTFCRGQIDRALSGMMGPESFLNRMSERYPSFMLSENHFDYEETHCDLVEGASTDGSQVTLITRNASSRPDKSSNAKLQIWKLRGLGSPRCIKSEIFAHETSDELAQSYKIDQLSPEGRVIRVGTKIMVENEGGNYNTLNWTDNNNKAVIREANDCSIRGRIVVLGSRKRGKKTTPGAKPDTALTKVQTVKTDADGLSSDSSETEASEEDPEVVTSTEPETENSAEETCSEGSTDLGSDTGSSEYSPMEDTEVRGEDTDDETSDYEGDVEAENSNGDSTDDERDEIILTHEQLLARAIDYRGWGADSGSDSESDYVYHGNDQSGSDSGVGRSIFPRLVDTKRRKKIAGPNKASVVIFQLTDNGSATQLFHYEQNIPVMLYESPPAIHPTEPLVAWPLCGGDVLFADYSEKTFFTRRIMPTTSFTRVVSTKLCFSDCGRYLHVVSLEARDMQKKAKRAESTNKPFMDEDDQENKDSVINRTIALSAFVSTHRLSARKTSRSPPNMTHHTKVTLGTFVTMSLERLPVSLTWAREHVYISLSGVKLNLFRVCLFKPAAGVSQVTSPRSPIVLPLSSKHRKVHYYPPTHTDTRGMVLLGRYDGHGYAHVRLVGAKTPCDMTAATYAVPPVGFYVDEERDLGVWGASSTEVKLEDGVRIEGFVRKMEHWDAEYDCDLSDFTYTPKS